MNPRKEYSRGKKDYQRGNPRFPLTGKAILIVTEGKITELNYFKALRDRLRLNATEVVVVHPNGTDPLTLVKEANELRNKRKREAKTSLVVEYDEVWVVFDLEQTHSERRQQAKDAKESGNKLGIRFAESDPCFEFWLLLHEDYTTKPFPDCESVTVRLKEVWPGYSKDGKPSEEFLNKLLTAITNAEKCREYHMASGGICNPSTTVDKLALILNATARPEFRIHPNQPDGE